MPEQLKNKYGIIILAAGSSSRLGKPKQLLPYQNKSLIRHAVDESIEAAGKNVILVLGADAALVQQELNLAEIIVVENAGWQQGMASSIRTGLAAMLRLQPTVDGIILTVCDQPFVSSDIFNELIAAKENSEKEIIASAYDDTIGTPALFGKNYFAKLLDLKVEEGAKKILLENNVDLTTISFPKGGIDIDTVDDYKNLLDNSDIAGSDEIG